MKCGFDNVRFINKLLKYKFIKITVVMKIYGFADCILSDKIFNESL